MATPVYRWRWSGFLYDLSMPLCGITYGAAAFFSSLHAMAAAVSTDLVANYNHLRLQDRARDEMAAQMEQIWRN